MTSCDVTSSMMWMPLGAASFIEQVLHAVYYEDGQRQIPSSLGILHQRGVARFLTAVGTRRLQHSALHVQICFRLLCQKQCCMVWEYQYTRVQYKGAV